MLFELKQIVNKAAHCQIMGMRCVVATVVDLEGSSYRKPGVRMLITENHETVGAVSGGCVEREVIRQAQLVFESQQPIVMTYDGRYKLGCEGILYILIEPFELDVEWLSFWTHALNARLNVSLVAHYAKEASSSPYFGTQIQLNGKSLLFRPSFVAKPDCAIFEQNLAPAMRLVIIGTEHDAVQMALLGANTGFEVIVISSAKDPRTMADFPGAEKVLALEPEEIHTFRFDAQTAIILMTHSYSKDLRYTLALLEQPSCYFGIIGSTKRREKLFDDILQHQPELALEVLESVHTPAGINIGAVTPQEIALSVLAEIVQKVRHKTTHATPPATMFK